MADGKGTCFVVMGFGKKTDFESDRAFDLDKSPWMADSTREQLGKLHALLADAPLKHLKAPG